MFKEIESITKYSMYVSTKKIRYSLAIYSLIMLSLFSVQYLSYIVDVNNKHILSNLEKEQMNYETMYLDKKIKYNNKIISHYEDILVEINNKENIKYEEKNKLFYIALQSDTIMLYPNPKNLLCIGSLLKILHIG